MAGAPQRHALPSGGWVDLMDIGEIRADHRKQAAAAAAAAMTFDGDGKVGDFNGAAAVTAGFDAGEAVARAMVVAWELPYLQHAPLPSTQPALLGQLTLDDYDALLELVEPARLRMFPKPVTPDDHADKSSPSTPVSDSAQH